MGTPELLWVVKSPKVKNISNLLKVKVRAVAKVFLKYCPSFIRSLFQPLSAPETVARRVDTLTKQGPFGEDSATVTAGEFFNRRRLQLSLSEKHFLATLFNVVGGREYVRSLLLEHLTDEACNLHFYSLSSDELLSLYRLCCYRGFYYLGFLLREHAINKAICSRNESKLSNSRKYLAACFEKEEFWSEDIEKVIEQESISDDDKLLFYLYASALGVEDLKPSRKFIDTAYSELLSGQSVAIAGPSEASMSAADIIDSYDKVIRLNYSTTGKGCDEKERGRKVNITYFNNRQTSALLNDCYGLLPPELEYVCFKSKTGLDEIQPLNPSIPIRLVASFDRILFNGTFNMGSLAAIDCLIHNPKCVDIYHMDLMLTVQRYSGYYPKYFQNDSDIALLTAFTSRISIVHDPVSNYRVFKRLWEQGSISGDERFRQVMELGTDEYMRQLQNIYGVH